MAYTKIETRVTSYLGTIYSPPVPYDIRGFITTYYEQTADDLANNRSRIKIEVGAVSSGGSLSRTYTLVGKVAGVTKINSSYTRTVTTSYTVNGTSSDNLVSHNADGTGSVTIYLSISDGTNTKTLSYTYTLPNIPRYAVINSFGATVDSPTNIACTWSTDKYCSAIYYSTNGGGSWSSSVGSGTSGSFNISGLTANTNYSVMLSVLAGDSGLTTESSALSRTTWYISTTAFSNFNLGTDVTATITRASSTMTHSIDVYAKNPDDVEYTLIKGYTGVGTSQLISFTSGELDTIYALIPTKQYANILLITTTYIGATSYGVTYSSLQNATVVSANPTFTTFTYADVNATTLALTGNSQTLIKGYSNVTATITTANKAIAIKGATMSSYTLVIGSSNTFVAYSSGSTVTATLNAITNSVMVVRAIDSRGNYTEAQLTATGYHNYSSPTVINGTAVRTDNIEEETTLEYDGAFYNYDFGDVTNTVTATYSYKITTDANYTAGGTALTPTASGQTYSDSLVIAGDDGASGFLQLNSYNIKIVVTDELSSVTYYTVLNSGSPNLAIHQDGVSVNGTYDTTKDNGLQVTGKIYLNGIEPLYKMGIALPSDDCDNALTDGCYAINNTSKTHAPTGVNYGTLWVVNNSGITKASTTGYCNQTCYDAQTNDIWYRKKIDNNAWGSWIRITSGYVGDYIQAYSSTNPIQLATSSGLIVPIDTVETYRGTSLTLDTTNKKIVIGAGVSKVRVTASVCPRWDNGAGVCGVRILKNASEYRNFLHSVTAGQYLNMGGTVYFDVSANDTISVWDYTENNRTRTYWGGQVYGTSLIVEVVK